ncbi:hypothetical protein CH305_08355 [Rhodococcus sp. 15-649-2-2]|nr:hypothetical protein CH305_08355 [Rhodococcus sp. 15-649-2-2]
MAASDRSLQKLARTERIRSGGIAVYAPTNTHLRRVEQSGMVPEVPTKSRSRPILGYLDGSPTTMFHVKLLPIRRA